MLKELYFKKGFFFIKKQRQSYDVKTINFVVLIG
jgi:hypothetical protein